MSALGPKSVATGAADDLVGRDDDLARLADVILPGRAVTLVGPAGVGKTRLALAVPGDVHGLLTYWVDLASETDATIGEAVAKTLGVATAAEQDLSRRLLDRLAEQPSLLVLDSCEHVLDTAAEFVEHICLRSPQTAVLATSRERLDLRHEIVYPVRPLAVPSLAAEPAEIATAAAVQLLSRRAANVRPGFVLSPDEAPAAARICRRLDGLPLGIELAASRLEALTTREIADGLDQDFALLGGGGRRGGRHRTLTAALDWSHALLDDAERALFRRLAVFPAGFDFDAAVDVARATTHPLPSDPAGVLDVLSRLIGKSFVTVSYESETARYRMLHIIRDYARERLRASGELAVVAGAHQRHYIALLARDAALIGHRGEEPALARLDTELDNLDATVRHTADAGPSAAAVELGTNVWRFCYVRGHYRRGRDWLGLLHPLADGAGSPNQHARMLHGEGMLAFLQCDYLPATRAFEAALSLFRAAPDPTGTADCLLALAGVAREQGRYDRAEALYAETLTLCAEADLPSATARALNYRAFLAWLRTDYDDAETLGLIALDQLTALGDHEGTCWAWLNLGAGRLFGGDLQGAGPAFAQARQIADSISFREGSAWIDHLRGLAALRQGSAGAADLLRSALAGHRALGDRWRVASVVADLAAVYAAVAPASAAALFGRADALWREIGSAPAPYERGYQEAARAVAAAALGERSYAAAWQVGRAAQPDQTLDGEAAEPAAVGPSSADESSPAGSAHVAAPGGGRGRRVVGATGRTRARGTALEIVALGAGLVRVDGRELVAADWGYAKPRELLFLLACSPPLGKDQIGTRLWPELDPNQLRNALHTALRDLRKALGDPSWIVYTDGRYTVDLGHGSCRFDVAEFEAALAGARASDDPDVALARLRDAIDLYQGDLLPALDADWIAVRREALRRAYVGALLGVGRELTWRRDDAGAAAMYELAVAHDPFLEVAHRELMLSWARAGEPGRAVEHFRKYATQLQREVGASPSAETRQLYRRLTTRPSS